jgi:hypothetical protein
MQGRHETVPGVERDFVKAAEARSDLLLLLAELGSEDQ